MAKKARAKRKPKPKQGHLDGMEPPRIKPLDDAADNYYEVMMDRVKLSKEEDEMKTALIEKMKEHGLDRYETPDGKIVTVTAKSNVKVKSKKATSEETEDEGEQDGE